MMSGVRKLWHIPARTFLIVWALFPIYARYFGIWLKWKWFKKLPSSEAFSKVHRKSAARFYRLAVKMRGGLIKVGQIISTRVDIMPTEWVEELAKLQDKVEPTKWSAIRKRIEKELGAPPQEVFEEISETATAAASFGQVHIAQTKEGERVALKVQYEDVRMKLSCDLWVVRMATPLFNIFVPKIPLADINREIERALVTELDYRQEAEFTRMIHANLNDLPGITVPRVVEKYTTEHVICTTFFDGFKVTDHAALERLEIQPLEVVKRIIEAYCQMFFVDGVFQSDPHPGNLLVNRGPEGEVEVCILDFGQVKVLPRGFQRKIVMASVAYMGRDVDGFCRSVVDMGVLSAKDIEHAKPLIREFFDEMFEMTPNELKQLDAQVMQAKIQGVIGQIEGVAIPQDIVLYGRAFGLLAGVIAALDSDINGVVVAKPTIMKALMRPENFGPLPEEEEVEVPAEVAVAQAATA